GVHLALADHLAVAGLEHEVVLAVAALLQFERAVALGVAAHRIDAVERRVACLVLFAGEDDLAVAGQQIEVELAIADLLQMELAGRHGDTSCAVCLPTSVGRFAHGCVSSVAAGHGGPNVVRWGRSTVGWTTFSLSAIAPARLAAGSMKRDPPYGRPGIQVRVRVCTPVG